MFTLVCRTWMVTGLLLSTGCGKSSQAGKGEGVPSKAIPKAVAAPTPASTSERPPAPELPTTEGMDDRPPAPELPSTDTTDGIGNTKTEEESSSTKSPLSKGKPEASSAKAKEEAPQKSQIAYPHFTEKMNQLAFQIETQIYNDSKILEAGGIKKVEDFLSQVRGNYRADLSDQIKEIQKMDARGAARRMRVYASTLEFVRRGATEDWASHIYPALPLEQAYDLADAISMRPDAVESLVALMAVYSYAKQEKDEGGPGLHLLSSSALELAKKIALNPKKGESLAIHRKTFKECMDKKMAWEDCYAAANKSAGIGSDDKAEDKK